MESDSSSDNRGSSWADTSMSHTNSSGDLRSNRHPGFVSPDSAPFIDLGLHHRSRKEVDWPFVQFLADYAATDPECPSLFKAYLEDVVLRQGPVELPLQVEYHLRNPQIKDYNLGPRFLGKLKKYAVYNCLYPEPGMQYFELPSAPIPESYQPNLLLSPGQHIEISFAADQPEVVELRLDDEDAQAVESESEGASVGDDEQGRVDRKLISRLRSLEGRDGPEVVPKAGIGGQGNDQPFGAIRSLSTRLSFPGMQDFVDKDEIMDKTGPDWETESWYRGARQPPLAARLDTIRKFLADEDVDRCMGWKTQFAEVVSYLEWLAHEDNGRQLENASPQTQALYHDAVVKAQAHIQFEQHHYAPTPLRLATPDKTPLKSTRLNAIFSGQERRIPRNDAITDRSNLLPRPIPPRPPSPVNRMPTDTPADRPVYDEFVEDEKAWWQPVAGDKPDNVPRKAESTKEKENLVYIEDKSFDSFSRGDTIGWVRTDLFTGTVTLPDGTPLAPDKPRGWAMERGARRAGLQQALRALSGKPPVEPDRPRRHIVFPTPAATLRKACESADRPQWTPPSLDLSQFADALETMPYTVSYRERLREITEKRLSALLQAEAKHVNNPGWVTLPPNLVNGGPFVWRKVDPQTQTGQDALKQCRTAFEVLKAAHRRVPRPLLQAVLDIARRGKKGEFDNGTVPAEVRLASDEWEKVGATKMPKYLSPWEVQWLEFLAGECTNRKSWSGRFVPDTPKDKYRLFQLFARKVQRLLDDRDPDGLFSRHDAEVDVEQLLEAINAGKGSSAVTKHEFQPHDACCWLDRMEKTGHVRFRLDLSCYGVVQRPEVEYFPEHRVRWPLPYEKRDRPYFFMGYIYDWRRVARDRVTPDVNEGSKVWNFFLSLAFRLGYTISMLSKDEADRVAAHPAPIPTDYLHDAIDKWQHDKARLLPSDAEPTPEELAEIRTNIINELATNATMLAPGRKGHVFDEHGRSVPVLLRDYNWDWASLAVRGESKRRQYWSVNRWPVGVGYLSERAERAVIEDKHLDPAVTHDPTTADPTVDWRFTRPKLRRYGQEKVVWRRGPAVFPAGDTRLQRDTLRQNMMLKVGQALGLPIEQPTWRKKLADLNPFWRSTPAAEEDKLPPVDPRKVPVSWDPMSGSEEQLDAQGPLVGRVEEEDGEYEDDEQMEMEMESVDVAMTGMF